MIAGYKKSKLAAASLILTGLTMFVLVNFTKVANLEAVTFNSRPVEDFQKAYGLDSLQSLFGQPLDSLTSQLLLEANIARVDINYSLPGQLNITTNQFDPACFVLDSKSGQLMGLTSQGRLVPIRDRQSNWELPVITSVRTGKLFGNCKDVRVGLIVNHLNQLRSDQEDIFRLINEIDLSNSACVIVSISGLPYKLRTSAVELGRQLEGFMRFLRQYQPELEDTKELDLRFADMIIQVGRGR